MKLYCTKCLPEKVRVVLVSEPTAEHSRWQFYCPAGRDPSPDNQNKHFDLFGWEGVTVEYEEKLTQSKEDIFKGQKEAKEGMVRGESGVGWDFPGAQEDWEESEASKKAKEQVEIEKELRKKMLGGE